MEPVVLQVVVLMITHLIISSFLVFIINPMMTYHKMKKEGLTAEQIIAKVKTEVTDPIVTEVDSKINNIEFPKIPDNIPDMKEITKLVDDMGEQLHRNMATIDSNIPAYIQSGIKQMEGRIYKAKGVDMHAHEKGMEVAKQVMVAEIENPAGEATPLMQIVRHFVQVAADSGLIDPEDADQKIGLIQGIIQGVGMLQNRGKAPGNGRGLISGSLLPPTSATHGNNMQYR